MEVLMIILIVLIYLAIGLGMSIGAEYPAFVIMLWFPILIFAFVCNLVEIVIGLLKGE